MQLILRVIPIRNYLVFGNVSSANCLYLQNATDSCEVLPILSKSRGALVGSQFHFNSDKLISFLVIPYYLDKHSDDQPHFSTQELLK